MKMKRILTIALALVLLSSCEDKGGKRVQTTKDYHNPKTELEYDVRLLFEVNGIKMYKFIDGRNEVYFMDKSNVTQSIHTEHYLVGRMQYEEKKNTIVNN
jgi:lipoprotein